MSDDSADDMISAGRPPQRHRKLRIALATIVVLTPIPVVAAVVVKATPAGCWQAPSACRAGPAPETCAGSSGLRGMIGCAGRSLFAKATIVSQGGVSHGETIVTDTPGLQAALARAGAGATIRLKPGRYAPIRLRGFDGGSGVTITSADPADPALMTGFQLLDTAGLTIRNLAFDGSGAGEQYALLVLRSHGVQLEALRFDDPSASRRIISAVMIRQSRDVGVSTSRFSRFWHGISYLDSRNVTLVRNEFSDMQTDAIRGGGVSDLTIRENVCYRFNPAAGAHPDCVQVWSTGQTVAARNITIRDNLVVRGGGASIQGVFIRDTFRKLPFENVLVQGNLTIGTQYNGITLGGGKDSAVIDNEVIAYPDMKSYIVVRFARTGVRMIGNRAMHYLLADNAPIEQRDNKVVDGGKVARERLDRWIAARPDMRAAAGPLLKSLIDRSAKL